MQTFAQVEENTKIEPINTEHNLIVGDARKVKSMTIGPVHLVVTSPPYWDLRDYNGKPDQIGFNQTLKEYINSLLKVWRNSFEALHPGGRMVINIGDLYLRASKERSYQIVPLHTYIINSIINDTRMSFDFLGTIIWRKVSNTKTTGGANVMGSYPYPRNVYPCFENEFISIFRKEGKQPKPQPRMKELGKIELQEWRELTQGVWTFPGSRKSESPSGFPDTLPYRIIKMFTFPGETVLDPFVGSGTTMKAAASLGRNSVGIEIGFDTKSGRFFEDVIRENVSSSEREYYAGEPKIKIKRT